jgi:urease accessory protein
MAAFANMRLRSIFNITLEPILRLIYGRDPFLICRYDRFCITPTEDQIGPGATRIRRRANGLGPIKVKRHQARNMAHGFFRLPAFIVLACWLAPSQAEAHTAFKSLGSFWSGVLHVLTSFDQLGFLLGLSIWVSLQPRRSDASVVGALCLSALFGSLIGWAASVQFDPQASISALMIVVGVAGAAAFRVIEGLLISVAACGGMLIGMASEMGAAGLQPGLVSTGGAIAAASVTSYGLIAITPSYPAWAKIALRAGASWIAAIGLMVFALAYSRFHDYG